jgi:hypothetical protein
MRRFDSAEALAEGLGALTFTRQDFLILPYAKCPDLVIRPFREAVLRLTTDLDGQEHDWEHGKGAKGTLAWIDEQLAAQAADDQGGLFGIFLCVHMDLGQALACFAVVEDDRGVKRQEGLTCDALFGCFHVFAGWRRRGIFAGTILPAVRDHCQEHAIARGGPVKVNLFTAHPAAKKCYKLEGFQTLKVIDVEVEGGTVQEELMEGLYTAS